MSTRCATVGHRSGLSSVVREELALARADLSAVPGRLRRALPPVRGRPERGTVPVHAPRRTTSEDIMAVPKRRTSKSRKRLRRGHHSGAGMAHPGLPPLRLAQAAAPGVRLLRLLRAARSGSRSRTPERDPRRAGRDGGRPCARRPRSRVRSPALDDAAADFHDPAGRARRTSIEAELARHPGVDRSRLEIHRGARRHRHGREAPRRRPQEAEVQPHGRPRPAEGRAVRRVHLRRQHRRHRSPPPPCCSGCTTASSAPPSATLFPTADEPGAGARRRRQRRLLRPRAGRLRLPRHRLHARRAGPAATRWSACSTSARRRRRAPRWCKEAHQLLKQAPRPQLRRQHRGPRHPRRALASTARSTSWSATASSATSSSSSTNRSARLIVRLVKRSAPDDPRARPTMREVFRVLDYSEYGGAPLLGVKGVSIICHGVLQPNAIKNAIRVAVQSVAGRPEPAHRRRVRAPRAAAQRMMPRPFAEIAGLGVAVPDRVVTNDDLEKTLDTSDQWIVERTGIRERRVARAGRDRSPSSAARRAAMALSPRRHDRRASSTPSSCATATPDRLLPSTACDLQALLGAEQRRRLRHRRRLSRVRLRAHRGRGAHRLRHRARTSSWSAPRSSPPSPTGRIAPPRSSSATAPAPRWCTPANGDGRGILSTFLRSDGRLAELLYIRRRRRSRTRSARRSSASARHYMKMAGREVFKAAVLAMAEACDEALAPRRRHRRRDRPARAPPGQPPDHRGDGEARRTSR